MTAPPLDVRTEPAATVARGRRGGGEGRLEIDLISGRSRVTRVYASNPLKILSPRRGEGRRGGGGGAWAYTSTYGGGLLAGDGVDLQVSVGPGATGVLCTQASTKVYRSPTGVAATQRLRAEVGDGGVLCVLPDPLVAFDSAVYEQVQTFHLVATAGLALLDWYTCGRLAMGERWAFTRYASRTTVGIGEEVRYVDAVLLEDAPGVPLGGAMTVGRFNCFATLLLMGEPMRAMGERVVADVRAQPLRPRAGRVAVASPIRGGVVLRVGGVTSRCVEEYLHEVLVHLAPVLGEHPWSRKW